MILYLETTFIVGAATGRDARADAVLGLAAGGELRVGRPDVCVMEACSWFEGERKRRLQFGERLEQELRECRRDRSSPHAALLVSHLEQAGIQHAELLNDVESRLYRVLQEVVSHLELIPLPAIARTDLDSPIPDQPTDNLIVRTVREHARGSAAVEKGLLSANTRDLGREEAQALLRAVGIRRYFTSSQDFLQWFGSRGGDDPQPGSGEARCEGTAQPNPR